MTLAIAMVIALNKLTSFGKTDKVVQPIPFEIVSPTKKTEPIDDTKDEKPKTKPKRPDINLYNEPQKGRYSDGDNANMGK